MQKKNRSRKTHDATNKTANLAVKTNGPKTARRREGYIRSIVPKTLSRTRSDIATWRSALRAADNVDNPRRARLMNLYDDVMLCAHLTSQIELRQKATLLTPFEIKVGDEIDDQATAVLNAASWVTELNTHILDSVMYGHTLVELTTTGNTTEPVAVTLLPRQNVIPEKGMLLFREDDSKGLQYREVREFGNFILEFGKDHDYGLLNKAVPHVLFMRFAQSCWSELCEIYGIPPRFMKTDTQDPAMLDRAEAMLRDMGGGGLLHHRPHGGVPVRKGSRHQRRCLQQPDRPVQGGGLGAGERSRDRTGHRERQPLQRGEQHPAVREAGDGGP